MEDSVLTDKKISDDLRSFILDCIESASQIEILVLISKDKDKKWTSQEIREQLRSSDKSVENNLKRLHLNGILSIEENLYYYSPTNPKLENVSSELIDAFNKYPLRILEIVYNKQSEVLREFSEAFRLRKDKKDG